MAMAHISLWSGSPSELYFNHQIVGPINHSVSIRVTAITGPPTASF